MVSITEEKDPTLEAMYEAIELAQDTKVRDYLGASSIGEDCPRKIWYRYNDYPRDLFKAETLLNFADGHASEDITADRLRMVEGITLITHDDSGNQIGFEDLKGKFKGHCDGMILGLKQAPKTWHVWEHKCSNHKKYNQFLNTKAKFGEKFALKNWNKNYYVQGQLYMHYHNVKRHYMTVALAGSRMYASCRTEYEPEVAMQYIDRADKIINAKQEPPRLSDKRDFFQCRWCEFSDECHGVN